MAMPMASAWTPFRPMLGVRRVRAADPKAASAGAAPRADRGIGATMRRISAWSVFRGSLRHRAGPRLAPSAVRSAAAAFQPDAARFARRVALGNLSETSRGPPFAARTRFAARTHRGSPPRPARAASTRARSSRSTSTTRRATDDGARRSGRSRVGVAARPGDAQRRHGVGVLGLRRGRRGAVRGAHGVRALGAEHHRAPGLVAGGRLHGGGHADGVAVPAGARQPGGVVPPVLPRARARRVRRPGRAPGDRAARGAGPRAHRAHRAGGRRRDVPPVGRGVVRVFRRRSAAELGARRGVCALLARAAGVRVRQVAGQEGARAGPAGGGHRRGVRGVVLERRRRGDGVDRHRACGPERQRGRGRRARRRGRRARARARAGVLEARADGVRHVDDAGHRGARLRAENDHAQVGDAGRARGPARLRRRGGAGGVLAGAGPTWRCTARCSWRAW